jgi:hypothetical protein
MRWVVEKPLHLRVRAPKVVLEQAAARESLSVVVVDGPAAEVRNLHLWVNACRNLRMYAIATPVGFVQGGGPPPHT